MPKLYEYFGLVILFYSLEHEPIHVHGKYQDQESKAEIIYDNGKFSKIEISKVKGKKPLNQSQMKKFTKQMKDIILKIMKADYLEGYKIKLYFSDGKEQLVDFENFLKRSRNPMTTKYKDQNLFKNFEISYGDLIWNDYEMCFPIWDLYHGNIG